MYALMGLGGQEMLLLTIVFAVFLLLPVIALIDVLRSDFRGASDKLIWVIVILFLNLIGALLYVTIGRRQRVA